MTQLAFDLSRPLARTSDPDTSHAAADRVTPKVDGLESRVVEALRGMGRPRSGLTCSEISAVTGIHERSVTPRMKPLRKKGLVWRRTEKRNGRTVWVAC